MKIKKQSIRKFRKALKTFMLCKLEHHFDSGKYDDLILMFLDGRMNKGDTMEFEYTISLVQNDVIFMNLLLGNEIDKPMIKRLSP